MKATKKLIVQSAVFLLIAAIAIICCVMVGGSRKKAPAASAVALNDGTFLGKGEGRNGPITVSVTVAGGKVKSAEIVEEQETPAIGGPVEESAIESFVKSGGNTASIDAVSGATLTWNGMVAALDAAMAAARGEAVAATGSEDTTADIVVIGAGGAGLTAATEAASQGKKVIVLEKMGIVGGNTNSATGGLNASETAVQKKLGIADTNDQFFADTMKGGHNKNDEALVRTMVENSAAIVDWLQSPIVGADLSDVGIMGGSTNKRTHRPTGGQAVGTHLVPKLYEAAQRAGADVRLNNAVTDIIEEGGKAAGVKVSAEGGDYIIKAKAVIIATGGFGANPTLIGKYRPELKDFPTTNTKGATGDAFVWIEKFGGQLNLMNEIQTHPTVVPGRGLLITEAVRGNGAIMVSHAGKRFINELDTRDVTSKAVLALPERRAYIFFNEDVRKSLKAIEGYVKAGLLTIGDSVEDIAGKLNMDAAVLKATLDTYNAAQASGTDAEFGRADMARSLANGPYYAVEIEPAIHHTMGGIVINTKAEVVKSDGTAVPGLYAAGEVTGGVHGDNRLGGNAIADITIYGKIAADSALAYIK